MMFENYVIFFEFRCKNFMACCIEMDEIDDCNAVARSIEALSNLSEAFLRFWFF